MFSEALQRECPDRFLSTSVEVDRFLASSQPRKIHYDHVIEVIGESDIQRVNVCVHGCKTAWPLFSWLNQVDVDVQVDLGHVLTLPTPGIHLVGRGEHVDIGAFSVSMWPMLTSLQRDGGQWPMLTSLQRDGGHWYGSG